MGHTLCWRDSGAIHSPLFSNLLSARMLNCLGVIHRFLCFCFQLGLASGEPQNELVGDQRTQIIDATIVSKQC